MFSLVNWILPARAKPSRMHQNQLEVRTSRVVCPLPLELSRERCRRFERGILYALRASGLGMVDAYFEVVDGVGEELDGIV